MGVLFIVKSGRFRLYRSLADGRTVTTAMPGPGSVFGEMDLLGMRMGGTWVEALEPGDLCLMSRADVSALLLGDPGSPPASPSSSAPASSTSRSG